ncbi:GNAT family N-acetyltransferase [Sabulilitoribacter multivorans]|uniref:GNAT family N-acetyltransferase n=1 Tax=Flaviramulus multivorans TaxID=1304750 RepID=A0ABS9IG80_9FLAO|nr:GNAT family N-acetyltransferase [Flaviramulus multivorans]MCF7559739.1 GNAT family N-acetyltransferase [Flaviramulus multivorans]
MVKKDVAYCRTTTDEELRQILKLQEQNLKEVLSSQEKHQEGFVTLKHSFDILKKMNDACAHCVAKHEGKVVGYALSMLQNFKNDIPLLVPMFNEIDKALEEKNLSRHYIAMGQVCVDKNFRGQGVFRGLYNYMANQLRGDFDAIITEVDTKNIRSSNAHKGIGFEALKNYTSNNRHWEVIILKL